LRGDLGDSRADLAAGSGNNARVPGASVTVLPTFSAALGPIEFADALIDWPQACAGSPPAADRRTHGFRTTNAARSADDAIRGG
jgi:hypothetical protein